MPYKLFSDILDKKLAAPASLVRLPLSFDPDESEMRELFMPPALAITLQQRAPKKAMNYNANIKGFLGRYVKGGEVDNREYMKCWKEDVFELRVQNQKRGEALRIFGAFGRPDTFIAFFRKDRKWFDGHPERWDEAIFRVVDEWAAMFPGCPRVAAKPFSNCITFNGVDVA